MATTLASKLLNFYKTLEPPPKIPRGVSVLFPQKKDEVLKTMKEFFGKYYNDNKPRRILMGINPGRFGGGITGINFTAPRQLRQNCGIEHPFGESSELSAEFIYEVIEAYGGPGKFYSKYFIAAVSPLGFVKDGVNMNYYDDRSLQEAVTPFIVKTTQKLISFGFETNKCVCIGGEKNYKYLSVLNGQYKFFDAIIPVAHPRFILQYRRKQKQEFIEQYLAALG